MQVPLCGTQAALCLTYVKAKKCISRNTLDAHEHLTDSARRFLLEAKPSRIEATGPVLPNIGDFGWSVPVDHDDGKKKF